MTAVESLSEEDKEFIRKCEEEFKDRFTENDEEFMKIFNGDPSVPPIVQPWWVSQNTGRRNNRRNNRHHPYERKGDRDDRRDFRDRRDYHDRRDNYDRRDSYERRDNYDRRGYGGYSRGDDRRGGGGYGNRQYRQ